MKNRRNRLFSLLLVLAMLLSMAPAALAAGSDDWVHITVFQNMGQQALDYSEEDLERVATYIAEQTGTYIDLVIPVAGMETDTLNMKLGAGEKINVFMGDWRNYVSKNMLRSIDLEVFDKIAANYTEGNPAWINYASDNEGTVWCLPVDVPYAEYPVQVRQDWLDKLNLEVPKTIEDLEMVMEAFAANAELLCEGEIIVMLCEPSVSAMSKTLSGAWTPNGNGAWLSEEGKIMPARLHEGYRTFIAKMAEWYEKGWIKQDNFELAWTECRQTVAKGNVGVAIGYESMVNLAPGDPDMLNQYTIIPNLTGPAGNAGTVWGDMNTLASSGLLITAMTTDEEYQAIANVVNWVNESYENFYTLSKGIPGVDFEIRVLENGYTGILPLNEKFATENRVNLVPLQFVYSYGCTVNAGMIDETGTLSPASSYIYNHLLNDVPYYKTPADFSVLYDKQRIADAYPNQGDYNTMVSSEEIKFVTGIRPMEEWDSYIADLYTVGVEKLIDAWTEQYLEATK